MAIAHTLGFPRMGARRELKWALERYWSGNIGAEELLATAAKLRQRHWALQREAGLDLVTVGDFSLYDHVLDTTALLGAVPPRFGKREENVSLTTYFRMARGRAPGGSDVPACEMTKWFDTNYHYLMPELHAGQDFRLSSRKLFEEIAEARALGHNVKAVLVGPLTWLWLSKMENGNKLDLLPALIDTYREIQRNAADAGARWLQLDEPILAMELSTAWLDAFESAYHRLRPSPLKVMVATYFGALEENTSAALNLPVDGIHVDLVRAPRQIVAVLDRISETKVLSLGLVDGRNVWRTDLDAALELGEQAQQRLGDRVWVAPSCSLLHVPLDVGLETGLAPQLKASLAFAVQKLDEVVTLKRALEMGRASLSDRLAAARTAFTERRQSPSLTDAAVQARLLTINVDMAARSAPHAIRRDAQQAHLHLPLLPTTTIGSFPQTEFLRHARRDVREGRITAEQYDECMRAAIRRVIQAQEQWDLDVLVHGEPERGDMVEYFAEHLDGIALTEHGWVQSYGSRCVRPPIIHADVSRPRPITVEWARYAQSLTARPVKGMLTGPITLLKWSFVRDDCPWEQVCRQLALALRDEVLDLERAGIGIIQIDEPALREGLPLRRREWARYLREATFAFRLTCSAVADRTQIHTHMCYSDFGDILEAIRDLDADVITIEAARSDLSLLEALRKQGYPNGIGPGIYDIHSPRQPSAEEMRVLAERLLAVVPATHLWLNPDCGLKTRRWEEIEAPLRNLVSAAKALRKRLVQTGDAAQAGNQAVIARRR